MRSRPPLNTNKPLDLQKIGLKKYCREFQDEVRPHLFFENGLDITQVSADKSWCFTFGQGHKSGKPFVLLGCL